MLETRQLHLLQMIAATGSYSAAGRELGLTQPAITYQMRALEKAVGTALAVRRGRYMTLTHAGEVLLAHADRVLSTLRAAEEEMGSFVGRDLGAVRLASFPSASATVVADAMAAAAGLMRGVAVSYVQHEPPEARALVRRGDVDVAVSYRFGPVDDAAGGLHRVPLLRDRMLVVLPRGHEAARPRRTSVAALRDDTWFLASDRFQGLVRAAAVAAGFEPRIVVVADDYVSMQALVARGLGIAAVPELALAAHRDPGLVARPVSDWPERVVEAEMWPDVLRVPSIASFVAVLTDAAVRAQARLA